MSAALTEQQTAFVFHFTSTHGAIGNAAEAARQAGYSERSAKEIGRQLLDKPHVAEAIDKANRDLVSGPAATKAVALLQRVIDDEEAPLKVRVDAAKTILDRAGIVASTAAERAAERDKDPGRLTAAGIAALREVLRADAERLQARLVAEGVDARVSIALPAPRGVG